MEICMKIYHPSDLEYIFYLKPLYCVKYFNGSIQDQKWLDKMDELFHKKVSVNLYSVFYNNVYIKYYPPFGIESGLLESLIEDCYDLSNGVTDMEMIQEKLKYFYQNIYKL